MNSVSSSAIFVKAYNSIVTELKKFGYLENYSLLNINTPITFIEMNRLRGATEELMARQVDFYIRYTYDNKEVDSVDKANDAEPLVKSRQINDGKGFLILPACSGRKAVYEYPNPEEVDESGNPIVQNRFPDYMPVLIEHFQDIISNLNSITCIDNYDYDINHTENYYISKSRNSNDSEYSTSTPTTKEKTCSNHYYATGNASIGTIDGVSGGLYQNQITEKNLMIEAPKEDDEIENCSNPIVKIFTKHLKTHYKWTSESYEDWAEKNIEKDECLLQAEWLSCDITKQTFSETIDDMNIYLPPAGCSGADIINEWYYAKALYVMVDVNINIEDVSETDVDHAENGLIATGCSAGSCGNAETLSDHEIRYNFGSGYTTVLSVILCKHLFCFLLNRFSYC